MSDKQNAQRMISGSCKWAKILGEAPENTFKWKGRTIKTKEWSFDLYPSAEALNELRELGLPAKEFRTDKEGKTFITIRKKATKSPNQGGGPAKPIVVVGPDKKPWPQDEKIGNGSVLNVKYLLNERGEDEEKRLVIAVMAVQVWDHVKYDGSNDFPTKEAPAATENWADGEDD